MSVTSRRPTARFIARPIPVAVMAILLTLGVHALALGHAVVWPKTSTAGGRERYVIRVPNERNVSTTRVEIQFPADVRVTGFIDVPGWRLEVVRDSAKRITGAVWTGDLPPERFAEFTFTATNPKDATAIVWPVLQRYADGENADWTGPAGSTRPALLGLFTDPYQMFGHERRTAVRAMRLVVDTGIIPRVGARSDNPIYDGQFALGRTEATQEVERYIANPGQALAYKIGQLTISRFVRRRNESSAPKFDVREFHAQILNTGALPLTVLSRRSIAGSRRERAVRRSLDEVRDVEAAEVHCAVELDHEVARRAVAGTAVEIDEQERLSREVRRCRA